MPLPVASSPAEIHPALHWAHPLVQEWFAGQFGTPTEPQEQGWPFILAQRNTLICAPTGSGKTLAAFLACIDRLVRKALVGTLADRTEVLYVSPLKALGNDVQKNLQGPLAEIVQLAARKGHRMPEIRTAVRTGDTLMPERRAMLKCPPHILVTTPESLYILLTAERSRAVLRDVETVIVDEIYAVAGSKRGAHLALSLERLEQVTAKPPVRIGLSATQKPLEEIAHFLTGHNRAAPALVNIGHRREMDIGIEVPRSELDAVASNEMWDETYARIAELVRQHRSTLVFVNTRRLTERVAMHLAKHLGEEAVAVHHGSLSRKLRLAAEKKLKNGEVAVLVATASLELGIDIGFVDLVVQIGSPRSIAIALQRIGRSGHWPRSTRSLLPVTRAPLKPSAAVPPISGNGEQETGNEYRAAVPKARLFVTTRDELLECAALVRSIRQGELDRIVIPEAPLDVLAQQIVAECAATSGTPQINADQRRSEMEQDQRPSAEISGPDSGDTGYRESDLYALVTRAYPYRQLPRSEFDQILAMLSEGIAARRGRYGAYLYRDRVHGRVRPRRGARLAAITSGGAIPDSGLFTMVSLPEGLVVGTLDEDFAVESNAGDIILLGNTSWRIRRVEGTAGRVLVEDAHGAPPSVPFWRGEAPARTAELSAAVASLREEISSRLPLVSKPQINADQRESEPKSGPKEDQRLSALISGPVLNAIDWLKRECGLDDSGAEQAVEHIMLGRAVLGAVPTQQTVIAERFFDEGGGMQLVIHAPFGARVNRAWGLALRKRFCRSFNFELQAAATDDGLNISLAEQHSFPLADVFHYLPPESVKEVVEQAVLTAQSPIFSSRWRWDAERALALLRFQHGRKVPPQIQRIRADDLLASVFPDVAACFENIEGDIRVPDHPLVREVMKDVLHEALDIDTLVRVLREIERGAIRCLSVDTPVPSQFAHEILNANPYAYLDDAPLEERRARAVEMRRVLPERVLQEVGRLDPEAIAQVRQEAWPDIRDADELHDLLQTLVALPEGHVSGASTAAAHDVTAGSATGWQMYFDRLAAARRAGVAEFTAGAAGSIRFWVAAEHADTFELLYPEARWLQKPASVPPVGDPERNSKLSRSDAVFAMVNGWMAHSGPVTAAQLAERLALPVNQVEQALLRMESNGTVLRGQFTPPVALLSSPAVPSPCSGQAVAAGEGSPAIAGEDVGATPLIEWCERRLLARIHRLTIGRLRKEIEPVTPAEFMRWLLRWQHVAPGTQTAGERGTLEVLEQLQGFEIPANAWESQILARRVADYDPKILDQLCLTGAVGWGRLSPHPATLLTSCTATGSGDLPSRSRRVIPTSVAPITFFIREHAEWMPAAPAATVPPILSAAGQQVFNFLRQRGASFFADIVRGTSRLKAEVETALWELVAAGLVTADGFDNLRALIDPKRRAGQGHGRATRPRHSVGRWSLLYPAAPDGIAALPSSHGAALEARTHAAESICRVLLQRYGVVFRELLARESMAPRWRDLLLACRRLEDRGEIRGGRFVSGFLGEQFALPLALDSLRADRKRPPDGETITVSAADPVNLVGMVVPGERTPAISGKYVSFRDGIAVAPDEHRALPVRTVS
jgi:ATP-dependent Lhr-like helicase